MNVGMSVKNYNVIALRAKESMNYGMNITG